MSQVFVCSVYVRIFERWGKFTSVPQLIRAGPEPGRALQLAPAC